MHRSCNCIRKGVPEKLGKGNCISQLHFLNIPRTIYHRLHEFPGGGQIKALEQQRSRTLGSSHLLLGSRAITTTRNFSDSVLHWCYIRSSSVTLSLTHHRKLCHTNRSRLWYKREVTCIGSDISQGIPLPEWKRAISTLFGSITNMGSWNSRTISFTLPDIPGNCG